MRAHGVPHFIWYWPNSLNYLHHEVKVGYFLKWLIFGGLHASLGGYYWTKPYKDDRDGFSNPYMCSCPKNLSWGTTITPLLYMIWQPLTASNRARTASTRATLDSFRCQKWIQLPQRPITWPYYKVDILRQICRPPRDFGRLPLIETTWRWQKWF